MIATPQVRLSLLGMQPLPSLSDDGLPTPEVGAWAEDKYQLVLCYATIFANAMSPSTWPALVYLDLFAGPGRVRIRGTQRIIPASPLLVLGVKKQFSKHIFCELDADNASALRQRAAAAAPERNVVVIEGDTNANVASILGEIPARALTFCFVDPFKIAPLRFATLQPLVSARRMDILVLIATGMDGNRNEDLYVRSGEKTVSDAVGHDDWRVRWPQPNLRFGDFVANEFGRSMGSLGYHYDGLASTKEIRNGKNAPIYRLLFLSKHSRGDDFWEKCKKAANPNRYLF